MVLSGAGRGLSLTRRTARKLRDPVDVLEIDVAQPEQLAAAAAELGAKWDRLDGLLHAIAFAPPECLGGDIFEADWEQVQVALHVSAYSLKALAEAFRPLLAAAGADGGVGASVVGLDFDATVAWPAYDWMGVSKAALESLSRYLARDLGPDKVRVNLVAAGRSRRWRPSRSPVSAPSRTPGPHGPRWAGICSTPTWWPGPASPCSPTSFP